MANISYNDISAQLAALDITYHSTYTTPEAIDALKKTLKTFNITIVDWNTLVDSIHTLGSTVQALYQIVPELAQYVHEQVEYMEDLITQSPLNDSIDIELDNWDEYEFDSQEV